MLDKFLNKIICGDSYKIIKEMPDQIAEIKSLWSSQV